MSLSDLCREFGVSRPTGYRWINRYKEVGPEGLLDLSRKPRGCSHATSEATENAILALRNKHPSWGARKLKARLEVLQAHVKIVQREGNRAWKKYAGAWGSPTIVGSISAMQVGSVLWDGLASSWRSKMLLMSNETRKSNRATEQPVGVSQGFVLAICKSFRNPSLSLRRARIGVCQRRATTPTASK